MHESLEQKLDISESNKLGDIYRELLEERSYRNADKLASVMTFWLKLFEVGRSTGVVFSGSSLNLIAWMRITYFTITKESRFVGHSH